MCLCYTHEATPSNFTHDFYPHTKHTLMRHFKSCNALFVSRWFFIPITKLPGRTHSELDDEINISTCCL